ncbi:MAG TPA: cysteine desulfurase family protein [Candidatus Saccharimonadia bacterium]|nr:cysteine desulfurase family protein [Candidatus Saccharimonadia bacterium]
MKQSPTKSYYLDHAASTPLEPAVRQAMRPYLDTEFANPSSLYGFARTSRNAVENARRTIANTLGAKPTEIVFTSGGTEGDNLAVQGVLRAHPRAHWITSAIEHDAVLSCVDPMSAQGHNATVVPVKPNGIVDVSELMANLTDETVLVSIMMANNEIGTIQPVSDIAKKIQVVRADRARRGVPLPLYLHTDAVQAAGYLDLHVARLGVDLLTIAGSKIYGPKGIGCLYVRHDTIMDALQYGGGQERGRRSGTENVAGIVGLATALVRCAETREEESHRVGTLRDALARSLEEIIPELILNGDPKRRLPNNLNVTIPGVEGEALVLYLDQAGIMASTGSACSTADLDPSHVLLAIGRTKSQAQSSLRLSLGRSTDRQAIDHVLKKLPRITERLREL